MTNRTTKKQTIEELKNIYDYAVERMTAYQTIASSYIPKDDDVQADEFQGRSDGYYDMAIHISELIEKMGGWKK